MEEMTIVRFFVDKEKRGKEKRRAKWQYFMDNQVLKAGEGYLNLITVCLPGMAYKKKEWNTKMWTEYLQGLVVPPEGRCVYYLYEDGAKEVLGREEQGLSVEWVSFMLRSCQARFEAMVLFWDRETENGELLEKHVRHTRYMAVVTEHEEDAAHWQDMLWEEYGFLLEVVSEANLLHIPQNRNTLIVAGKELYGLMPGMLTPGTLFVSTRRDSAGKKLCARAKDVKYIDIKCFLAGLLP